jgi:two-component system, OmpR family, response regulator ResD
MKTKQRGIHMSLTRILIADDEPEIRNILREYLSSFGYEIEEAENGKVALAKLGASSFDILIVDIMMPMVDGWEVCAKAKELTDVSIIVLSAKGQEYDKLRGFELGVEDYMVKPFSLKELQARINVVLRRRESTKETVKSDTYELSSLVVDFAGRNVTIDGEKIKLTPKEFDLLEFLIHNKGLVLSRDKILDRVWGIDYFGEDRTVDTHVKMLRESLGDYRDLIATVWGIGYKFEESGHHAES